MSACSIRYCENLRLTAVVAIVVKPIAEKEEIWDENCSFCLFILVKVSVIVELLAFGVIYVSYGRT